LEVMARSGSSYRGRGFVGTQKCVPRCSNEGSGVLRAIQVQVPRRLSRFSGCTPLCRRWNERPRYNFVALCPNCHREAHVAPERDQLIAELYALAQKSKAPTTRGKGIQRANARMHRRSTNAARVTGM